MAIFAASGRGASAGFGADGAMLGATLLGFTSVFPTNVTPSSMTSFEERTSPKSSVLALSSILSLATTFPVTLPRTTTEPALMLPLITALSPRLSVPSEAISPSSFPSKVSSPVNRTLPLISTSEFKTFFVGLGDVVIIFIVSCALVTLSGPKESIGLCGFLQGFNRIPAPGERHKYNRNFEHGLTRRQSLSMTGQIGLKY